MKKQYNEPILEIIIIDNDIIITSGIMETQEGDYEEEA